MIEVDGPIHKEQVDRDAERTHMLEVLGCRVLRFTNEAVENSLSEVLETIQKAGEEEVDFRPHPSPALPSPVSEKEGSCNSPSPELRKLAQEQRLATNSKNIFSPSPGLEKGPGDEVEK